MPETTKKCPFSEGCPFRECKTKEEISARFQSLKSDPTWAPLLESMGTCPLWQRCPFAQK